MQPHEVSFISSHVCTLCHYIKVYRKKMRPVSSTTKLFKGSRNHSILAFPRSKTPSRTPTHCFITLNTSEQTPLLNISQSRRTIPIFFASFYQHYHTRHFTTSPNMTSPNGKLSLEERLKLNVFNIETKTDAINGRKVPLEIGAAEMQACIIRGIRHHDGFGTELKGVPKFDRALNARAIMSNRIPEIEGDDRIPYCIWYPEVATEETYRQLAKKYPYMRYHVGRACAVAGYVDLYCELDLLPEVAIAEEARDNKKNGSSIEIFNGIMAAPTRFAVMNDYTRTVNIHAPLSGACLNADTAVRSSLDWRRGLPSGDTQDEEEMALDYSFDYNSETYTPMLGVFDSYWNITEDWKFDEEESEPEEAGLDLRIPLLYSPLPRDLPALQKDILICHSAYTGNIDRYMRLRRPVMIELLEEQSIIRGIHYNTMFAKFWSLQPEITSPDFECIRPHGGIIRAINARYIMNNNLTRINENTLEDDLPYLIYWPNVADEEIYAELFKRKPTMKLQIARACIVANYQELYEAMDVEPDVYLAWEARESSNPFYAKDQQEKAKAQNYKDDSFEDWKHHTVAELMRSGLGHALEMEKIPRRLWRVPMDWEQDGVNVWDGLQTDMTIVEDQIGRSIQPLYQS